VDEVRTAVERSALRTVSPRSLDQLLSDASRRCFRGGAVIETDGEMRPHVHLVLGGLVRMSVRWEDGRTMTVRYCRTGSLIGIASVFANDFRLPVAVAAVTATELLSMRPALLQELAAKDATVSAALLAETGSRVQAYVEEIARSSFSSVPARVARHLLDLASDDGTGALVAELSQETLAAAVGTVREVAARALRGLRDGGLVSTERSRVVILDPEGLLAASGTDSVVEPRSQT
jgi:CRP/FNR family transcriptional regulator, cyclic AMP receptor protein